MERHNKLLIQISERTCLEERLRSDFLWKMQNSASLGVQCTCLKSWSPPVCEHECNTVECGTKDTKGSRQTSEA